MRSQIEADRAQKLAERFKLILDPAYNGPDREISRVEKPIRMRIHRTCHKCNTTFRGGAKTCANCEHVRCKSCPRYPLKKTEKKDKTPVVPTVVDIEPDTYWGLRERLTLTKPNPKPGCQPLVRKEPKQRVRRHCHLCQTLFKNGNKTCASCEHVRCVECPRDPYVPLSPLHLTTHTHSYT